jgi:hypothetical protein
MGKYREKPGLATVCSPQGIAKTLKRLATETKSLSDRTGN